MISLFLALLRNLLPIDGVARVHELTRWFVGERDAISQDPPSSPISPTSRKHFARALQDNVRSRFLMPENEKAVLADGLPEFS
jgi:hypothetical protein